MTLQELKIVLDKAIEAAYKRLEQADPAPVYLEYRASLRQNINLLQDLHLGVVRTMEAQPKPQHVTFHNDDYEIRERS